MDWANINRARGLARARRPVRGGAGGDAGGVGVDGADLACAIGGGLQRVPQQDWPFSR